MGMILRIASSRIVGQGDIVGRSGYFSLNLSANSVMRGRLDARRTLKSLVADLRYTWQDIHIFAKLRGINLSDTAHVSVNRYVDASRDMPLWEIDVRDSVQPDKVKVILVHGETGEVVMDSYE